MQSSTPQTANIAPYDANIDQNNNFGGYELLANYVQEQLGSVGNVLGVNLGAPVPSIVRGMQNAEQLVTAGAPGINWLGVAENPTDDISGAQKAVADAITRYKENIQAVIAYNDQSALGASLAFKNAGIQLPVIVGQLSSPEGLQGLKDGSIAADIEVAPWRKG